LNSDFPRERGRAPRRAPRPGPAGPKRGHAQNTPKKEKKNGQKGPALKQTEYKTKYESPKKMASTDARGAFKTEMECMLRLVAPLLPAAEVERVRFGIDLVLSNPSLLRTVSATFCDRTAPLVSADEFAITDEVFAATIQTGRKLDVDFGKVTAEINADVHACLRRMLVHAETLRGF
jgi:hypothetical protein